MINAYDFDGTIYDGDSSADFYFYCLKRRPLILICAPIQIWGVLLYFLKIKDKDYMKERIFSFLKYIPKVDNYIEDFWKKKEKKIKNWYLEQKQDSDVIISASPEFLLKPIGAKIGFQVIATKVDKTNGKYLSKNCHDYEKIKRFEKEYKGVKIRKFYSDSIKADLAMLEYAKEGFVVKKNDIYKLDEYRKIRNK